jgi:hypothetical protein
MGKTVATEQEAVADIVSGSTIPAGGFACGTPWVLLEALLRSDAGHLEVFRKTPGCRTRVSCPPAGSAGWSPRRWARTKQRVRPPVSRGELEVVLTL